MNKININPLIQHLIQNNMDEIVSKSLLNCHLIGLHSIMLLESPQKTIRLYFADYNHDMWKNYDGYPKTNMSLAFHPHHCNLTLHCILGRIWQWRIKEEIALEGCEQYIDKYIYKSQINTGKGGFELSSKTQIKTVSTKWVYKDDFDMMNAREIHTVAVENGQLAAWLVYEGMEDEGYNSVAYSWRDLSNFNTDGLYQKPTKEDVISILQRIGLI